MPLFLGFLEDGFLFGAEIGEESSHFVLFLALDLCDLVEVGVTLPRHLLDLLPQLRLQLVFL